MDHIKRWGVPIRCEPLDSYPLIEVTPLEIRQMDSSFKDVVQFRIEQTVLRVVRAGILPVITWPGHEDTR